MAKCVTDWDSWINPKKFPPTEDPNNGKFIIEDAGGNDLKGKHKFPGGIEFDKVKGKCKDNPDRISFESEEDTVTFKYLGLIFELNSKTWVIGCRTKISGFDRKALLADDEVWVGVKTT